jgi:hypothetical protein
MSKRIPTAVKVNELLADSQYLYWRFFRDLEPGRVYRAIKSEGEKGFAVITKHYDKNQKREQESVVFFAEEKGNDDYATWDIHEVERHNVVDEDMSTEDMQEIVNWYSTPVEEIEEKYADTPMSFSEIMEQENQPNPTGEGESIPIQEEELSEEELDKIKSVLSDEMRRQSYIQALKTVAYPLYKAHDVLPERLMEALKKESHTKSLAMGEFMSQDYASVYNVGVAVRYLSTYLSDSREGGSIHDIVMAIQFLLWEVAKNEGLNESKK